MNRYHLNVTHPEIAKQSAILASEYTRATERRVEIAQAMMIADIVAQARLLTKISLDECNGVKQADGFDGWSDVNQAIADQSRDIAERHVKSSIESLFTGFSWHVEFNRDPRGAAIAINIAHKNGNHVAAFYVDGGYQ